jgi:hypothetical protein
VLASGVIHTLLIAGALAVDLRAAPRVLPLVLTELVPLEHVTSPGTVAPPPPEIRPAIVTPPPSPKAPARPR